MAAIVPQMEIFVIDLHEETDDEEKIKRALKERTEARLVFHNPIFERTFPVEIVKEIVAIKTDPVKELMITASFTLGKAVKDVRRFIEAQKFHVIRTNEELSEYKNANDNNWIATRRGVGKPQYYVRHPKIGYQKVLIEADKFYDYIYEEYSKELINYCTSHCRPKIVQINKQVLSQYNARASFGKKRGAVEFQKRRGNVFEMINPNGARQMQPLPRYLWLEEKLMHAISSLNKDGHVGIKEERDFTFGVSVKEAKIIGLDLNLRKQYMFTIYVEC